LGKSKTEQTIVKNILENDNRKFSKVSIQDTSIIGTWISEEDNNYKMVFNGTTCTWLYSGQTTSTYNFTLSNSSSQCQQEVPVTTETKYLQLINPTNPSDKICYEIFALSETTLTLRVVDQSGFLIFNRQ
jgi:hypothetical protein